MEHAHQVEKVIGMAYFHHQYAPTAKERLACRAARYSDSQNFESSESWAADNPLFEAGESLPESQSDDSMDAAMDDAAVDVAPHLQLSTDGV